MQRARLEGKIKVAEWQLWVGTLFRLLDFIQQLWKLQVSNIVYSSMSKAEIQFSITVQNGNNI